MENPADTRLLAVLRAVEDGIIGVNASGQILFMNPAAEKLTGWRGTDALGSPLTNLLHLPIAGVFDGETRVCKLISKTCSEIDVEIKCSHIGGERPVGGTIILLRDLRPHQLIKTQLANAQGLAALAGLAGSLAHEFNNQLTVILGYADELANNLTGVEREDAIEIKQAAGIASSISSQLLALSRGESGKMEVLDLNQVVREIQPLLCHALGRRHRLVTRLTSDVALVRGDRNRLKQVLLNLTLNARDAMSTPGEVQIGSIITEIAGNAPHPGTYARLAFADSGDGMDAATLSRMSEPHFTTKQRGCGSGLGLSIVHHVIEQSGGFIHAASTPGIGTSFEILLPCVAAADGNPICFTRGRPDIGATPLL